MPILQNEHTYVVATRCFTYNHASYILDTLSGFVKQETSFPVVYIIVDDASTDGEQDVLRQWAETHLECAEASSIWSKEYYGDLAVAPLKGNNLSKYVIMLLSENHYQHGKSLKRFDYISKWFDDAKYQALCEGDDYWSDGKKLQKQVDLLEKITDVGMCYTKCQYYFQDKEEFSKNAWGGRSERFEDLIKENTVPTPSVLYRQGLQQLYDAEIMPQDRGWLLGDYPFWLWLSKEAGVKFMDEVTCVYRVLEHSASHRDNKEKRGAFVTSVISIQQFFADRYGQSYLVKKDKLERSLLMDGFSNKDYKTVIRCYQTIKKPGLKATLKYLISLLLARRG